MPAEQTITFIIEKVIEKEIARFLFLCSLYVNERVYKLEHMIPFLYNVGLIS